MLHVEYNIFFSIDFPVFPNAQFLKLTFVRDSSCSFQFNIIENYKHYYNKYTPIEESSYHLTLFSCKNVVYYFLATTVYSYGDISKPGRY